MSRLSGLAAGVVAAGAIAVAVSAQQPVFVSRSDVVRLDVQVTERNRPLLGLAARDFTVLDNGVPQQVEFLSFDELPLNMVLTFDLSGSVAGSRLEDLRAAGRALIDQLRKGDRAALVSFNHALSLGAELTADLASVRAALDRGGASGLTALVDASFAGLTVGVSDVGRSVMLVFSDGVDTSSWLTPAAVIDAATRTNVVVSGVAVGRASAGASGRSAPLLVDRAPFLKNLVEVTGGDLVELQFTRQLRDAFVRLLAEYRQRYLIGYSPAGVSATGWHKVDVSVSRKGAVVKTRAGYTATR